MEGQGVIIIYHAVVLATIAAVAYAMAKSPGFREGVLQLSGLIVTPVLMGLVALSLIEVFRFWFHP